MVAILYDDDELCPQAFYKAGESFNKAGLKDKSREMFTELIEKYPESPLAVKAREQLERTNSGQ